MERTRFRNRLAGLLLLFLISPACSRPDTAYRFVSAQTALRDGGSYRFEVRCTDTMHLYSMTLAARVMTGRIPDQKLDVIIRTESPDGETTVEPYSLPLKEEAGVRMTLGSGSVADFEWPWQALRPRSGQEGSWQIVVTPAREEIGEAIYGFGLSYKERPWEKEN